MKEAMSKRKPGPSPETVDFDRRSLREALALAEHKRTDGGRSLVLRLVRRGGDPRTPSQHVSVYVLACSDVEPGGVIVRDITRQICVVTGCRRAKDGGIVLHSYQGDIGEAILEHVRVAVGGPAEWHAMFEANGTDVYTRWL
jgi:hypothetical protein